jgi:lysozyme
MAHKLIDVSGHQGKIDFEKVEASGVKGVFIKSTEGATFTDVDDDGTGYRDRQRAARQANLRTSFYHFTRPRLDRRGEVEAEFFWNAVKGINAGDGDRAQLMRLVVDIEDSRAKALMGVSRVRTYTRQLIERLRELADHKPILYTFPFYIDDWGDWAAEYPLWIADPSAPDLKPRLPKPFTDFQAHQIVFGEHVTNPPNIPGVPGGCDENLVPALSDLILNRQEY